MNGFGMNTFGQRLDAVIIVEDQGRVLYANPAVERLLGWDVRSLFGAPFTTLVPERKRPNYLAHFNELLTADPQFGEVRRVLVDSTNVRAHRHAAGAARKAKPRAAAGSAVPPTPTTTRPAEGPRDASPTHCSCPVDLNWCTVWSPKANGKNGTVRRPLSTPCPIRRARQCC